MSDSDYRMVNNGEHATLDARTGAVGNAAVARRPSEPVSLRAEVECKYADENVTRATPHLGILLEYLGQAD
jgi:hypothetical protein